MVVGNSRLSVEGVKFMVAATMEANSMLLPYQEYYSDIVGIIPLQTNLAVCVQSIRCKSKPTPVHFLHYLTQRSAYA